MPKPQAGNDQQPLTPPVFHILLALADGERHGYGIMQDVARQTGGSRQIWWKSPTSAPTPNWTTEGGDITGLPRSATVPFAPKPGAWKTRYPLRAKKGCSGAGNPASKEATHDSATCFLKSTLPALLD